MRRFMFLVLILLCGVATSAQAAWYIGPTSAMGLLTGSNACSDSAAGTRLDPFCTMGRAKTAMAGSGDKQTYFRGPKTYALTSQYTFGNNENFATDPLDTARSAVIDIRGIANARGMACNGCNTVSLRNLTFSGSTSITNGITVFIQQNAHHFWIESNTFLGDVSTFPPLTVASDWYTARLIIYNSSDIYIRNNAFLGPNQGQPISNPYTDPGAYVNIYITDNTFAGCDRWCIEGWNEDATGVTVDHYHIDRNVFDMSNYPTNYCDDGIPDHFSGVQSYGGNLTSNTWASNATFWGNTINFSSAYTGCKWGVEVLIGNVTMSLNTFNWPGRALAFGRGFSVVENNTFNLRTSGSSGGCGGPACAYECTGGYTDTEWIGVNTINGASVTGCQGIHCGTSCPGIRADYGTKPQTWAPSAPFATGPDFTFTATTPVASGATSTLTWSAVTGSPTSCTASVFSGQADTAWSTAGAGPTSAQLIAGGTKSSTARTATTVYRMSCTDGTTTLNKDQTVTITGSPPAVPGTFAVSGPTPSTVNATWVASPDVDGDFAGYRVYVCQPASCTPGGTPHMTLIPGTGGTTTTAGTILGLRGGLSYSVALRAFDIAGNESGNSNVVTVNTSAIPATNPELLLTYEVGAGTQLFDSSGHGHNSSSLTGTFSATAHDGSFAGAFSGTQNARIPRTYTGETPIGFEPTAPTAITLATWVRPNGAQGDFSNLMNKTYQNNTGPIYTSYKLVLDPALGDTVVECEVGQTGTPGTFLAATSPAGAVPNVIWTHVACTYDPSAGTPQLKLYVAGEVVATATSIIAIPYQTDATGDFWLSDSGAGTERFVGNLDDTRVYRGALSQTDIRVLAGVSTVVVPSAPMNLRVVSP